MQTIKVNQVNQSETISFSFEETKAAFIELYGNTIFNQEFCSSFDEAFREAWESFDYIAGAESLEEFAQGLCECWQLQES